MASPLADLGFVPDAGNKASDLSDLGFVPDKPAAQPVDLSKIKLNPIQQVQMQSGNVDPELAGASTQAFLSGNSDEGLAQVAPYIAKAPGAVWNALTTPLVEYGTTETPEDVARHAREMGLASQVSPVDDTDESAAARGFDEGIGNLGMAFLSPLGLAATATGGLPTAAQRAISLGFAGQMAADTPQIARELGTEMGKNPEDQDQEKISNLKTQLIGNTIFSAMAGAHGLAPAEAEPTMTLEQAEANRAAIVSSLPQGFAPKYGVNPRELPPLPSKSPLSDLGFVPESAAAAPAPEQTPPAPEQTPPAQTAAAPENASPARASAQPAPVKATVTPAAAPKYPPLAQSLLSAVEPEEAPQSAPLSAPQIAAIQKLRGLGINTEQAKDLLSGAKDPGQVINEMLAPFEEFGADGELAALGASGPEPGSGMNHYQALTEAKQQAEMQIRQILEETATQPLTTRAESAIENPPAAPGTSTVRSVEDLGNERQRGRVQGNPGMTAESGSNPDLGAAAPASPSVPQFQNGQQVIVMLRKNGRENMARIIQMQPDGSATVKLDREDGYRQVNAGQIFKTKTQVARESKAQEVAGLPEEQQQQTKTDAAEFTRLFKEYGPHPDIGWFHPEALGGSETKSQGIQSGDEINRGLVRAFKDIGSQGDPRSVVDRANALPALRNFIEQKGIAAVDPKQAKTFQKDIGQASKSTEPLTMDDLQEGSQFSLKGAQFTVRKLEYDEDGYITHVVLDDGKKYGTQEFFDQRPLRMDKGSLVAGQEHGEAEAKPPENKLAEAQKQNLPPAETPLETLGSKEGFAFDGPVEFPGVKGKLLSFTFKNVPKDDPAYGATFYAKASDTAAQIVEKGRTKAAQMRSAAPTEAPEAGGFRLDQPESAEQQKAREAEEEQQRQKKSQQEKLQEGAAKPLVGSVGDIGQTDMLGGGDLFSQRAEAVAQKLESLKTGVGKGQQLHAFGVPSLVWDTAISGAQAAIRAGGKIADAVAAAIKHIRDNFKGDFDEAGARDAITKAIRGPLRLEKDAGDNWQDLLKQRAEAADRLTKAQAAREATRGKGAEGMKGSKGIKDEAGALRAEREAARQRYQEINQKLLRSPGYIRSRVEAYSQALKQMEAARASGDPTAKANARQALDNFNHEFEQMPSQVFAQVWKQMQAEGKLPPSEQMPAGRSLQSLTDWLRSHDVDSPKVPLMEKLRLGDRAAAAIDGIKGAYQKAVARAQAEWEVMKTAMTGAPVDNDFRRTIKQWIEADTHTGVETADWVAEMKRKVPSPQRRAGISVWLDANGDEDELQAQRADLESIGARRWLPAWDAALKLTEDEKSLARQIQADFATKLEDGRNVGLIDRGRDNYGVPQIWDKQPQPKEAGTGDERNAGNPRAKLDPRDPFFALQRSVPSYFDGIMSGGIPKSLDVGALVGEYNRAFHKALSSRAVIWNLKDARAKDGTPVVKISGSARIEPLPSGGRRYLVDSSKRPGDAVTKDGRPYQPIDHWALRGWTYKGSTEAGSPVLVNGDFLVHPDHYEFLKNELMNSPLREGKVGKVFNPIFKTAAFLKASKFSLGTFHLFTVAKNMGSFGVSPFTNGFRLDLRKPEQALLVRNGLELGFSREQQDFMEGLASGHGGIWGYVPYLGDGMGRLSDFIFKDYLPTIKMKVALKVMEDNRKRYGDELNDDQLAEITANAINAGAGLQSYRLLGTSKFLMDLSRLALVAPDFMLSEAKLFGGALTKYGAAQRRALLLQAVVAYVGARAINAMLNNGNPHMELKNAFSVVYKGRAYGIRLPIVDLWNFIASPTQFMSGRLGPIPRGIDEAITGRDMRTGVSKDTWTKYPLARSTEIFLRDAADWITPAGLEGFLPGSARREQTPMSSILAGQFGITSHQYTAQTQMWDAAAKFNRQSPDPKAKLYQQERDADAQGESDYRGLDDLLRAGDTKAAKREYQNLIAQGHTPSSIAKRYQVYTDAGTLAHPFTGNQQRERQFTQAMSDSQRTTYRAAIEERKDLQGKFRQMLQSSGRF